MSLRQLLESNGISQLAAARALFVDGRTVRRWLADPGCESFRAVPFASLELLRRMIASGELKGTQPIKGIPLAMLPRKITR
jgi:hypothetical protein